MSDHAAVDPPVGAIYDANAEYYDTITRERIAVLAEVVRGFAARLPPGRQPVVDIGAGTGRLTTVLAQSVDGREVLAVEPSRSMRAILTSRLADDDRLLDQVTVIPCDLDGASDLLPDRLGGAVAFGVLPHLDPSARSRLLDLLAQRLEPDGRAVIEVMRPWSADPVRRTPMGSFDAGRHRIECDMRSDPVGSDGLRWTMSYRRVDEHGTVLHEAEASSRCWVVGPEVFTAEVHRADLDLAWPAEDIAEIRRPDRP